MLAGSLGLAKCRRFRDNRILFGDICALRIRKMRVQTVGTLWINFPPAFATSHPPRTRGKSSVCPQTPEMEEAYFEKSKEQKNGHRGGKPNICIKLCIV